MKPSRMLAACLLLLVGYIAATALNRPSSAQPPAPHPAGQEVAVWRYQLTAPIEGNLSGYAILTDTATGQCWRRYVNEQRWEDWGSPAQPR
jgi:hypothetical protein